MTFLVMGTVAFDTLGTTRALPAENSTARLTEAHDAPGGAAGNFAFALARLGVRPTLVAVVGEDFAGSEYERRLAAAGVDLMGLGRAPGRTAHAFMFSDLEGSQHVYFHPGASEAPAPAPRRAAFGHFAAGNVRTYAPHMEACDVVGFDPGQEVFHRDLSEIEACFPLADNLFLNEFELARLEKARGWTLARLFDVGVGRVIVTRGARGTVVHEPGRAAVDVPAVPAKLVDPTGAGDAHRAGFSAALADGASVLDAARLASVVAAFAVETLGPQTGLPTRAEAQARYRKTFGDWPFS